MVPSMLGEGQILTSCDMQNMQALSSAHVMPEVHTGGITRNSQTDLGLMQRQTQPSKNEAGELRILDCTTTAMSGSGQRGTSSGRVDESGNVQLLDGVHPPIQRTKTLTKSQNGSRLQLD